MRTSRLPNRVRFFLWLISLVSLGWLALWGYTGYFRALISISVGFTFPLILVMVLPVLILMGSGWILVSAVRAGLKKKILLSMVVVALTLVVMAVILFTSMIDRFLYG